MMFTLNPDFQNFKIISPSLSIATGSCTVPLRDTHISYSNNLQYAPCLVWCVGDEISKILKKNTEKKLYHIIFFHNVNDNNKRKAAPRFEINCDVLRLTNNQGCTPLHVAAANDHLSVVKRLASSPSHRWPVFTVP